MVEKIFLLGLIIAIILLCLSPIFLYIDKKSKLDNLCIIQNDPQVVITGYIQPPRRGSFTITPQVYYLYYKGKRKSTDEECRVKRCVTEKEYERHMYK